MRTDAHTKPALDTALERGAVMLPNKKSYSPLTNDTYPSGNEAWAQSQARQEQVSSLDFGSLCYIQVKTHYNSGGGGVVFCFCFVFKGIQKISAMIDGGQGVLKKCYNGN